MKIAVLSFLRSRWLSIRGAKIGKGTHIHSGVLCPWPHQIAIGSNCLVQPDVFFNYDHHWTPGPSMIFGNNVFIGRSCEFNVRKRLVIGNHCLIASGVKMIDHDHGTKLGMLMREQEGVEIPIEIGDDVWIGVNSIILKGVRIGSRAIVGAGSVVTKSIPHDEIWAGVPARRLGTRGTKL